MNGDNVKKLLEKDLNENDGTMAVDIPSDEINDSFSSCSSDTDDDCDGTDIEDNKKDKNKKLVWSVNMPIANNEDNEFYSSTEILDNDNTYHVIDERNGKSNGEAKIKNEISSFVTLSVVKDEKSDKHNNFYSMNDIPKAFQGKVESKKRIVEKNYVTPFVKYNALSAIEGMADDFNTKTDDKLRKFIIPIEYNNEKSTHKDEFINSNRIQNVKSKY